MNYAIMFFIPPNTVWCDGDPSPVGYWAWGYIEHLNEVPTQGDAFVRDDDLDSYDDCLADMRENAESGLHLYLRGMDGIVIPIRRNRR